MLLLLFLALAVVFKSWREVKNSPYYFMRRQAEKRLQTYSFASLAIMLVTAVTAGLTLQPVTEQKPLFAIISDAKPLSAEDVALMASAPSVGVVVNTAVASQNISTSTNAPFSLAETEALVQVFHSLPEEFDRFEPTAELTEDTALGEISFSTEINDEYQAVSPRTTFSVGNYTVYATFAYEGMADGMEWAWVWRHEGEVVDGGNELWNYGDDGPGYIYFGPEEGFRAGDYTLEVWVNGELFTEAAITMTGSALSTGN
jgi:hypothetical protein